MSSSGLPCGGGADGISQIRKPQLFVIITRPRSLGGSRLMAVAAPQERDLV